MRIFTSLETLLLLGFSAVAGATSPIQNYVDADLVLGQADFISNLYFSPPTASTLNGPSAVAVDPVTRKVFVSDTNNSRVLRFGSADALKNNAAAEAVFGQQSLSNVAYGPTSDKTMSSPQGIFFDYKGRLWVTDADSRILMFNNASSRNSGEAADRVFGQPDFTGSGFGPTIATRTNFNGPNDLCVDAYDRLWVADSGNNRVLRFDAITTKSNGAGADGVLGQANFTTGRSGLEVSVSSSVIGYPTGVSVSGNGILYVVCGDENRVVRFDRAAALANGAPANAVFGQPDFTTRTSGTTASMFADATGVFITPDDALWVTDTGSNRLLRFSAASTQTSGAVANGVLGQPDFTRRPSNTTIRDFDSPRGKPFVDATGSVWIADARNNRVLRFSPDTTQPLIKIVTKIPSNTKLSSVVLKGTTTDASGIKFVQYRTGKGPLKMAKGTTSWSLKVPLKKGRNLITLTTTDNIGNVSSPITIKIIRR